MNHNETMQNAALTSHTAVNIGDLVYSKEKTLFKIGVVISTIIWLILTVSTFGMLLLYIGLFYLIGLFGHSVLISMLKGNGVRIDAEQFPDIHQQLLECCSKVGITKIPEAYIFQSGGMLNAFATRFLGRNFVGLYSDIVDATTDHPEILKFYIGHELGHIQRKHIFWGSFLFPVTLLPLYGTAYHRAREYTCDQFGLACCGSADSAIQGLTILAVGAKRYKSLNVKSYLTQLDYSKGFWMSLNELLSDYPWLVKRVARVNNKQYVAPNRNIFAWILSALVPRLGMGGGAGGLVFIALIGVMAALAVPAYQDYVKASQMQSAEASYSDTDQIIDSSTLPDSTEEE